VTVVEYNRRSVVAMSVGGLAVLAMPPSVAAAAQCVSVGLQGFLPNSLTVDCASAGNFRTFRQYPDYLGLAGVVSMSAVRGKLGSYQAGNLFLFPWLKPKGQGRTLPALLASSATAFVNASPIPDATLPVDEYFCRVLLQAPWTSFIGFQVDRPFDAANAKLASLSNTDKLADGSAVGVDWTSSNLNNPWFGGSSCIPGTADCDGSAWRKLITSGLNQASTGAC
jgi:hypothetical protein